MTADPFRTRSGAGWAGLLLASLCACTGNISAPPGGTTIPPNVCTSAQVALTNTACELTLGQWKQSYLAQPKEQDWYSVNVGNVDVRSIGHVVAGYFPPPDADAGIPEYDGGTPDCKTVNFNTAVNLTVNVLDQAATLSLATAADVHGTACPVPNDITFRYSVPNTSLVIVLEDDTGTKVDTKNKYSIMAEVLEDPDVNEPNDTPQTATPIQLTNTGGVESGQNGGYLATPDDLDYFSVTSPGANYVLWVQISQDPAVPAAPPHKYRLEYYIYGPDGTTQLGQGYASAGSQFSSSLVAVGDAILLDQAGPYYILVQGYRDSNTVGQVPGDLHYKYLIQAFVVPLQDPTEPNNSFATAYAVNGGAPLALNGTASVTARTSYVADDDWYAVTLAPNAALALLHYKFTLDATGGRFPPLPTNPSRTLFVYTQAPDSQSCLSPDAGVCVISAPPGSIANSIAAGACFETPSKCLQSYRVEALPTAPPPVLTRLRNFESMLQVPPHAAAVTYYFFLQPLGDASENNGYWADDKDYTVLFEHLPEPDSLEKIPNTPRLTTLAAAPGGPIVGVPVYLSFGLGKINPNTTPTPSDVIFAPEDYDGRGDDVDPYQIALPFNMQQAWQISWSVPTTNGTDPDYDLGFTLSFCDNNPDAGTGTPPCYAMVSSPLSNPNAQLGLAYSPTPFDSWWNPNKMFIPDQVVYTQTVSGGVVTTTVTPYGCFCFEPDFVSSGSSYFLMNVFPLNRTSWSLVPYTVTTSYSAYPYAFTNTAGTQTMCPVPCNFTVN